MEAKAQAVYTLEQAATKLENFAVSYAIYLAGLSLDVTDENFEALTVEQVQIAVWAAIASYATAMGLPGETELAAAILLGQETYLESAKANFISATETAAEAMGIDLKDEQVELGESAEFGQEASDRA